MGLDSQPRIMFHHCIRKKNCWLGAGGGWIWTPETGRKSVSSSTNNTNGTRKLVPMAYQLWHWGKSNPLPSPCIYKTHTIRRSRTRLVTHKLPESYRLSVGSPKGKWGRTLQWVCWSGLTILLWLISEESSPSCYLHPLGYRVLSLYLRTSKELDMQFKCSRGIYWTDLKVNSVEVGRLLPLTVTILFKTTPFYHPPVITTPFPFSISL